MPALDYPFASDFYSQEDCRYSLTDRYKTLVKDAIGVMPYNCKLAIPRAGQKFFNVYLYFKDIAEVFTPKEYRAFQVNSYAHHQESQFTHLFSEASKQYPIEELFGFRLNPNGVFVQDYKECSLAYTADKAFNELKELWACKYSRVAASTRWNSSLYLFFHTLEALHQFVEKDAIQCKKDTYAILKKHDKEGGWRLEELTFTLDLLETYKCLGQHYFNSDEMSGLKTI